MVVCSPYDCVWCHFKLVVIYLHLKAIVKREGAKYMSVSRFFTKSVKVYLLDIIIYYGRSFTPAVYRPTFLADLILLSKSLFTLKSRFEVKMIL